MSGQALRVLVLEDEPADAAARAPSLVEEVRSGGFAPELPADADRTIALLAERGHAARAIGEVTKA